MKREWLAGILAVAVLMAGCKGKTGPAGADGTDGTNGQDTTVNQYTAVFTSGVAPSTSYAGVTFNRIDATNATTNYQNDGSLYFANSGAAEKSVLLVKFDISGFLPQNASVSSAALELVLVNSTNLGGSVTIGVHELKTGTACSWTSQVNWNYYDGSAYWFTCSGGASSTFSSNTYNGSMGKATLAPSFNGGTNRIGLSISASTINDWLGGNNNGLAITSEHEGSDAAGVAVFAAPNNGNVNIRPTLKVNYTL